MFGSAPHTTNNRMELTAAIEGLRALEKAAKSKSSPTRSTSRMASPLDPRLEAQGLGHGGEKPVLNQTSGRSSMPK